MTDWDLPLDRRALLRTTGAGVLGAAALSESRAAPSSGGEEIWRFRVFSQVEPSPTVVDDTVFVGSAGDFYAVDAADGTEQWKFDNWGGAVYSSPTVADSTVYIGSVDENLWALDAADGTEKWRFPTESYIWSSPTVAGGTVFVGSEDNTLYAVDSDSGEELWTFDTGDSVHSSPTVIDSTVFVGSEDHNLYALDANSGEEQWRYETNGDVFSSPTVADGTIFIGGGFANNNVYALSAGDGTEQWSFETGDSVRSSPTVVNNTVFVGSRDNNVYALSTSDGTEQWSFETGGEVFSSPTVADGTVFVGSKDNNIYALDAANGTEQWRFETEDEVNGSPTVVNGVVYIGDDNLDVYALDAGVSDSSEGSRVNLGTLGHHHVWADKASGAVGFDPAVHGFNFPNWIGQNTDDDHEDFDSPHDHQTIAEEEFNTQFDEHWAPTLKDALGLPIPPTALEVLASAVYETFQDGPEAVYSDGHCYGICLTAQQYFEEGIPESLPEGTEYPADIPQPTGEYDDVGIHIDDHHRAQFLSSGPMEEAAFLSPDSEGALEPIDAEAEVDLIRSEIDQRGTAMIGISTSPAHVPDDKLLHQVLGHNVDVKGESLSSADTAVIDIYDPDFPAEAYEDDSKQLQIDISEPTLHPVREDDGSGYRITYERFALVGPSRPDAEGAILFGKILVRDILSRFLEGYVSVVARSPIRIDAIAPDGTTLSRPAEDVDGTPPSEIVYLTGADAGRYDIRAEGTGDGEYGIEVAGQTPEGGRINDSIEGEITEGETQTVAATVPESEDEGKASADEPTLFDYTNNNDVVDTANLQEAIDEWQNGEAGTKLLRDVIDAWRSGDPVA
jgi:outer membrane protein assembly factor BamB